MSTLSTCRGLNSSTSGNCPFERIRRRHVNNKVDVEDCIQSILYNQIKEFSMLDSDVNMNGADSSTEKKSSDENCRENVMEDKNSTATEVVKVNSKSDEKEEIEPCKIAHYREALLKYSRITFSDFTSLFNKFVRENGRDFSKANLMHWFDKFTKFIYLKKVISGEPTDLREQLSFRAIQSKRNSLAERLYTLREQHEMDLTLEEFSERLKNKNINPINKLLNLIQGSGDTNMLQQKETVKENKLSADGTEGGRKSEIVESNESTDKSKAQESSAVLHKTNDIRAETIDLERESASCHETGNNLQQQTTTKVKTKHRKNRTSKSHKSKEETVIIHNDGNNLESTLLKPKIYINPFDPKQLPPVRDQSKCVNSTIYITRNGLVKVSQHIETNYTKQVDSNVYEQSRSINFYVDHLDEKDPLPAGIEVKPLPPGGLEEVLRTVPPMTDKDIAEFNRVSASHEKEVCPVHFGSKENKANGTVLGGREFILKPVSEEMAKELNEITSKEAQAKRPKAIPKYKIPRNHRLQSEEQTTHKQDVRGNLQKSESVVPTATEDRSGKTNERPPVSNLARSNQNNSPGFKTEKEAAGTEQVYKTRRFVPARRRLKSQAQDTTDNQSEEKTGMRTQDSGSKADNQIQDTCLKADNQIQDKRPKADSKIKDIRPKAHNEIQDTGPKADKQTKDIRPKADSHIQDTGQNSDNQTQDTGPKADKQTKDIRPKADNLIQDTGPKADNKTQDTSPKADNKTQDTSPKADNKTQDTSPKADKQIKRTGTKTDIQIKHRGKKADIQTQDTCPKVIQTPPAPENQLFDQLPPLHFIDTDTENVAVKPSQEPVFLETNATIDYSRHVVEPSHGDRPNKKKLQAVIKEKIKTKGEANKHLKAKYEKHAYYFDEDDVDTDNVVGDHDSEKDELESSVAELEEESISSPVVYATDQPQILDNREYMMVPEEIIRLTDPRLKDIEDKYSITSPNEKKDKKKRKDKKNKAMKNIPIKFI
ncbi:uncharacterized protein LOC123532904 [Mercenaria mercenaria]|uniref:uncharacterized protein LOC123532904 n=1 Tax=Mercenaria mercenaria TaxID=6596 RepID=UPI00234F7374|nr:uncharacterized protein LOC123532904 [Mercenaria mercenaria]